jgi:DNA polymerase-1
MAGRRRYLPDLNSDSRQRREMAERMALNAPIQGTAADIVKLAMIAVAKDLEPMHSRLLLQVHDELVVEVAPGELNAVTAIVRAGMEHAVELSVPMDVNIGIGRTWHEAAH